MTGDQLYTRYPIVARALGLAAASIGILHTRRSGALIKDIKNYTAEKAFAQMRLYFRLRYLQLSAARDNARTEGEGERGTKLSQVYHVIMPERQECGNANGSFTCYVIIYLAFYPLRNQDPPPVTAILRNQGLSPRFFMLTSSIYMSASYEEFRKVMHLSS